MSSLITKLLPITAVALALSLNAAAAAPAETPSPPLDATKTDATKTDPKAKGAKDTTTPPGTTTSDPAAKPADKKSSIDSPQFLQGYRAAYATIYDRGEFASAIVQLKALGQDDRADVANLIGYSYRKLGNFEESKNWYERALRADPNHVKTWQYYGLWQVEQGNRQKAMEHLNKIGSLCGFTCPEYQSLGEALATSSANY